MPLYTFYPCHEDGGSETFHTIDLPDDEAAYQRAPSLLQQHRSCDYVAIWRGERMVGRSRRPSRWEPRDAAAHDRT